MNFKLTLITAIFLAAGIATAQPGPDRGGPPDGVVPGGQTITEIVIEAASDDPAEFTLLLDAILYIADTNPDSDLVAGLFDDDQYTVFAPNDQAFLALVGALAADLDPNVLADEGPFAAIDDLLGPGTVEAVVSYHVTEGRRASISVLPRRGERTIETLLDGATFSVDENGTISAVGNTAEIGSADTSASNGIIHEIDAVILPIPL
ncbi:MAG: fasciclin domain-containing protein [Candidatus Wenzhouxiangella sp. M2_3B_020]